MLDLIEYRVRAAETPQAGLCLWLEDANSFVLPSWIPAQIARYLEDQYRHLERLLDLGPFHHLLPLHLRRRAVAEQFKIPRFVQAVAALHPVRDVEGMGEPRPGLLI